MLTRKNFEYPEKGKAKKILEISRKCFLKINHVYKRGVNSWGYAVNNPCVTYDHKSIPNLHIEAHSFQNNGMNERFYLVIK